MPQAWPLRTQDHAATPDNITAAVVVLGAAIVGRHPADDAQAEATAVTAFLHAHSRSTAGLAVFGAVTRASAQAALFLGILLAG